MVETLSSSLTFCISCNNSRGGAKSVKETYLIKGTPTPVFLCKMSDLEHTSLWCPLPYLRKDIAVFNGMSWRTTKVIKDLEKVCKKKAGTNHQGGIKYPRKQTRGAVAQPIK